MGTKPVHVLAGLALVGMLSAGCQRSSTVGGFEGSARVSNGPAGFNTRGSVATRTGTASVAAAGQTGMPATSTTLGMQQMPAGTPFPGNTATSMSVATTPATSGMPAVNQTAFPNGANGMSAQGSLSMPTQGGGSAAMQYSGAQMPAGHTMDEGAAARPMVGGVVPSQNAFGGAPQVPMSTPQSTLAPGGAFTPNN